MNNQFVFRFPRRQLGADCLATEIKVLPSLAPHISIPISVPTFVGRATELFCWPFAGYQFLPGTTACTAPMGVAHRSRLAHCLGNFLRSLHAVPDDVIRHCDAPGDLLGRLQPDRRIPQALERLDTIRQLGFIDDTTPWKKIVDVTATARAPRAECLVHGDLYARHLVIDDHGQLAGVIDWGDVHFGDPALDLSIAHSFLPPSAHAEFREAYGPIDEATWTLARFRALLYGTLLIPYAHAVQDRALLREALWILHNVRAI